MARRAILKTHLLQCQRHGSSLRPGYGLASPRSRRVRDRDGVVLQKRELLKRTRLCPCRLSHLSACPARLEVNLFSTVRNRSDTAAEIGLATRSSPGLTPVWHGR